MFKKNNKLEHAPRATAVNMAKGTARMFLAELLFLPTGLVTAVFLARTLGPVDYGLFSLLALLVVWVEGNTNSVFTNVSVKIIGEEKDWKAVSATVIRIYLTIGSLTGVLFFFLAEPLSELLNEPSLVFYIQVFSVDILLTAICCANRNILIGRGFFTETALIKTCTLLARLGLIILFVELGFSFFGAVLGLLGATTVNFFISTYFARPAIFQKRCISTKRIFDIGAPLFFSQLAINMIGLHFFILKIAGAGPEQIGYFGAALNLSIPPSLFAMTLSTTLYSTVNRMQALGEKKEAQKMIFMALRSVFFLFPFAFMSAGLSEEIVLVIYGNKFLPSAPILALMIFVPIVFLINHIAKIVLIVNDKSAITLFLTIPVLIVAAVGHILYTSVYKGVGAAGVTLAAGSFGVCIAYFFMYKTWRIKIPVKTLVTSVVSSAIAYSTADFIHVTGFLVFPKIIIISSLIIVTFYLAGEFKDDEIKFAKLLIKRNK